MNSTTFIQPSLLLPRVSAPSRPEIEVIIAGDEVVMLDAFDTDMQDTDLHSHTAESVPQGPSRADWVLHRQRITQLYTEQNMTLRKVTQFMKTHHGFHATEKMYKQRIKQWGLDKKLKRQEVIAMMVLQAIVEASGVPLSFSIRGKVISASDLARYLKRAPLSQRELHSLKADDAFRIAPSLTCYFGSRAFRHVKAPDQFRRFESLLHVTSTYSDGLFDSSLCYVGDVGLLDWTSEEDFGSEGPGMLTLLRWGNERHANNQMHEAGVAWRIAFILAEDLAESKNPTDWLDYLYLRCSEAAEYSPDLHGLLNNHLLSLIQALPSSYPHKSLARGICLLDCDEVSAALSCCYDIFAKDWSRLLSPLGILEQEISLSFTIPPHAAVPMSLDSDIGYHIELSDHVFDEEKILFRHCANYLSSCRTGDWQAAKSYIDKVLSLPFVSEALEATQPDSNPYTDGGLFLRDAALCEFRTGNYELARVKYDKAFEILSCAVEKVPDERHTAVLLEIVAALELLSKSLGPSVEDSKWRVVMARYEREWEEWIAREFGDAEATFFVPQTT